MQRSANFFCNLSIEKRSELQCFCTSELIRNQQVTRFCVTGRLPEIWSAIDKCKSSRRGGGVKGGAAAEHSEGTLDAAEHCANLTLAMALLLLHGRPVRPSGLLCL